MTPSVPVRGYVGSPSPKKISLTSRDASISAIKSSFTSEMSGAPFPHDAMSISAVSSNAVIKDIFFTI